jgi:hypothetical protein
MEDEEATRVVPLFDEVLSLINFAEIKFIQ